MKFDLSTQYVLCRNRTHFIDFQRRMYSCNWQYGFFNFFFRNQSSTFLSSQRSPVEIDNFSEWISIFLFLLGSRHIIIFGKPYISKAKNPPRVIYIYPIWLYDLDDPADIDKLLTATLTTPTTLRCLMSGLQHCLSSFL